MCSLITELVFVYATILHSARTVYNTYTLKLYIRNANSPSSTKQPKAKRVAGVLSEERSDQSEMMKLPLPSQDNKSAPLKVVL